MHTSVIEAKQVVEAAERGSTTGVPSLRAPSSTREDLSAALHRAVDLQNSGQLPQARQSFLQILEADPLNVGALHSMAVLEANAGNDEAALGYVERALAQRSDFQPSLQVRQTLRARLTASAGLGRADVHRLTIQALEAQRLGNLAQAAALLETALRLDPENFIALYSLAVIRNQCQQIELALPLLLQAVRHHPTQSKAHFALGTVLQGMGLHEAALASFDRAIETDPESMEAYNNKASLLHSMGRQKDALLATEVALQRNPQDTKSLNNRGYLLTEFKMYPQAAATFGRLLDIDPDYELGRGLHLFAKMHACDWTDFERDKQLITEGVRAGKRLCSPMPFMAIAETVADARKCAEVFGQHKFPPSPTPLWDGQKYLHRRKRVAFISGDFRQHPVGYLLVGLIERLRGGPLETYCISSCIPDSSDTYRRFRCGFDHYLDVQDKSGIEVARLLRAHEIDIAIDLSGYTAGSRLEILSHRPAPVQMTYLGYPGTLGLPYIDYLLADKYTVPEHLAHGYSEKILHLPHCYLPRDVSVLPSSAPQDRQTHGLPDKGTVFCSFNHDYKISPAVFDCWLELLRDVPGSVLWLMKLNDAARTNLGAYADERGIDPRRLVFAQRVPDIADHLARYRLADVFLDTYPYNGHTTASDALLAGLPVVTMAGETFASRVAGSLLNDLGLGGEWVCADPDEYRRKALEVVAKTGSAVASRMHLEQAGVEGWPVSIEAQVQRMVQALSQVS
jgi:predicted O-linked N-acetylglucosamine transferase (SPINDLY family)